MIEMNPDPDHMAHWRPGQAMPSARLAIPKASSVQVGGSHYKDFAIQPAEFIHKNNIGFLEGNVIKYVCRHKGKDGAEALRKARHYIDLLLEYEYSGQTP